MNIDRSDTGTALRTAQQFSPGSNIADQPRLKSYYGARVGDFPPWGDVLEAIMAFLLDTP